MNSKLLGTGVALVTPFDNDNSVDFNALGKLINYVSEGGVDYLVALGTTAETPTLNSEEKKKVTEFIVNNNPKNLPVVLGIGGNNTADVVKAINTTDLNGISAILSVTPYYNKPSQKGIYEHYKAIASHSPLPIVMYNVPGRTGVNMTADTTLKLSHDFKNIIAIKEASGNLGQMGYIVRDCPKDFLVISGDDNLALPGISIGMHGVISVAANSHPAQLSEMVKFALNGNFTDATKIHLKLIETVDLLFAEGNPVGVKAALSLIGIIKNNLRLPLVTASQVLIDKLKKFI